MTDETLRFDADDPQTYIEITKMRETAEAIHGRDRIEQVTEEYRSAREELQARPKKDRKRELLRLTSRLEQEFGYEVLAGVPRLTRGSHPRHRWDV